MSSSFREFPNNKRTLILDGGLATTLEDVFHKTISHSPLWSGKVINEDPESIIQAHLAFLRAGADIILTSTYQCCHESFAKAGFTPEQAVAAMLKSVNLADEARTRFVAEQTGGRDVKIGLSLGPFGAILSPAREFDGVYPPPYGPKSHSASHSTNTNTFDIDELKLEEDSIQALTSFHLQRLRVFSNDADAWAKLDCIAFETVPLLRETIAIKRAILCVYSDNAELEKKPWWISANFPGGKYPQSGATAEQVVRTILKNGNELAIPDGVGINCTPVEVMAGLVAEMAGCVQSLGISPWLVLYPNNGDVYDSSSQTWSTSNIDPAKRRATWAEWLAEITGDHGNSWGCRIVGGCCRTGPEEIEILAGKIRKQ